MIDDKWPQARLIPTLPGSGVEAQERRAASVLLAVMQAVDEFGRALLKPLGAPSGRIQTFIETPVKLSDGRAIRPDGIIAVTRGARSWTAVVETKVGPSNLEREQIETYLDLARERGFDAVLSISNHYVTSSSDYPIEFDRRKKRKVDLHHWSWFEVLTEAVLQGKLKHVGDRDQAYMLDELVRFLEDQKSGALPFSSMGPSWTAVKEGARDQTLRKTDDHVAAVAARWDELVRYVELKLTRDLGKDVRPVVGKREEDPLSRRLALTESLATSGLLYAQLQVPDAAGPLNVVADLRSRQITVSTELAAPRDGRTKGRVSWLLRQLRDAPDDLAIGTKVLRSTSTYAALLGVARENPDLLYPESSKEVRGFVLKLSRNMGVKRDAGKGSFIESVATTVEVFYEKILQNLRPWKAAPPKLHKKDALADIDESVEVPKELEPAVEDARAEMAESGSL